MALYYSLRRANHEHWGLAAAALDRDAAAWVKPAARRDVGGIRHGVAEADIRHAAAGLGRQHAFEQRLRIGMAGGAEQRVGFVALDDAAEIHDGDFTRHMLHHR